MSSLDTLATAVRRLQWALLVAGVLWLLSLLAPILAPFAMAALLGWLGDPWVDRLQRRGHSRVFGVVLVFTLISLLGLLALLVLLPLLQEQLGVLLQSLPRLRDWLLGVALPWLQQRTGFDVRQWLDPARLFGLMQGHWDTAGGVAKSVLGTLSRSGFAVLGWVANLVLLPVLTFYFLRDWDALVAWIGDLVPRRHLATVTRLASDSDAILGAFLRGQLLVMVALGVVYSVGLWLVGLDLALLIGTIAGLVSFVPYLGTITGVLLAVIAALMQFGDWTHLLLVLLVFVIGQSLEGYVLTPRLIGDRIGLHAAVVIFAVMAGGQLFGLFGMLVALPVAAVGKVLIGYLHERYRASGFYGAQATPPEALTAPTAPPVNDDSAPPPA